MVKLIKEDTPARLNFKGAGFKRVPENDFSDDGARFRAYEYNGIPISYTTYNGDGYLSIRVSDMGDLNYNEYSKLPSYKDCDKYNGVPISSIDLNDVKNICDKIKAEYEEAISKIEDVDEKDLMNKAKQLSNIYKEQLKEIEDMISANIRKVFNLNDYKFRNLKQCYNYLYRDSAERYANISDWPQSDKRYFINTFESKLKDAENSFWYTTALDLIKN